jgi:NAD(P)-dependent dehydrogenase (short-subunit alcohol dehydrogenase family)
MELTMNESKPIVIVTGASRGIGRAIAQVLSAQGAHLVLVSRSEPLLESLARELATDCLVLAKDLRKPDAAAEIVTATLARFGGVTALVNNAGAAKRGDFLELTDADWEDGFALKFFGAMRLCREAWPALIAAGGAIVNIAGIGGRTGSAEFAIGGAVNAAVMNLTKALADRGSHDGVRVNAVNPGTIATERLRARLATFATDRRLSEEAAATEMAHASGVRRFGTPEEVARVVAFLLSPESSYMQGAIVDVDGGQTRTL